MRARVACALALLALAGPTACGDDADAGPICLVSSFEAEIGVGVRINPVDLLLVVDDSPSMAEEQALLQAALPDLVSRLADARGQTSPLDLHVAVVSADMGSGAAPWPGCQAQGDDGLFQRPAACGVDPPAFLTYHWGVRGGVHPLILVEEDPPLSRSELACRARLGADGCGFSQPLEAALKALWPSADRDPETGEVIDNRITFRGPEESLGHGDRENADFLRNDVLEGLSAIAVVVVTDKDDCSTADWGLFEPVEAEAASPSARCARRPGDFYTQDRYLHGLRALRPGAEGLVHFAVLAGVPPELTGASAREAFDPQQDDERDAHYQAILDHPEMQLRFETTEAGVERLASACENDAVRAEPARRLVQVARRFGENGNVHSICDPDWMPLLATLEREPRTLGHWECPSRRLLPAGYGLPACDLVWELPSVDRALEGTPIDCGEAPFLSPAEVPRTEDGRKRCVLRQLAVTGSGDAAVLESGQGWFYDETRIPPCRAPVRSLYFTPQARPPPGVRVKLQCQEIRYRLPPRDDLDPEPRQPHVLGPCEPDGEDACARRLRDGSGGERGDGLDRGLVCHAERALCVLPCDDAPCPDGWSCNRDDALPHCEPGECRVP